MSNNNLIWQSHAIDDLSCERTGLALVRESGTPMESNGVTPQQGHSADSGSTPCVLSTIMQAQEPPPALPRLDLDHASFTLLAPRFDWASLSGSPNKTGTLSAVSSVLSNTSNPDLGNYSVSSGASGTVSLGTTSTYATLNSVNLT